MEEMSEEGKNEDVDQVERTAQKTSMTAAEDIENYFVHDMYLRTL